MHTNTLFLLMRLPSIRFCHSEIKVPFVRLQGTICSLSQFTLLPNVSNQVPPDKDHINGKAVIILKSHPLRTMKCVSRVELPRSTSRHQRCNSWSESKDFFSVWHMDWF